MTGNSVGKAKLSQKAGTGMRIKRSIIILLLGVILPVLSACQLAQEDLAREEAWMIGVFITPEHLDLFDQAPVTYTRFGRPDFSALFQPGRLYAQWDEAAQEFIFPDVDGIPFFTANSPVHNASVIPSSRGISGGHTNVFVGDDYHRVETEGTIYIVPGTEAMSVIHINQVFQTSEGDIFLTPGSGFSGHGLKTEGRIFSTSWTETRTVTENRAEITHSTSVTLNVNGMFAPVKIVLLQMDEYNNIVARTQFAPDEMPDVYYLNAATTYIIVETHRNSPEAHDRVVRELVPRVYAWEGQLISTFMAREDGILEKNWTEIIWQGE